jgi:hypothetical protein
MPSVIDFLEGLGQNAQLRHATRTELEQALLEAQLEPAAQAALLQADRQLLEQLLEVQANVCCMVHAPEEEEEEPEPDDHESEEDDDGDDEQTVERKSLRAVAHRVATA